MFHSIACDLIFVQRHSVLPAWNVNTECTKTLQNHTPHFRKSSSIQYIQVFLEYSKYNFRYVFCKMPSLEDRLYLVWQIDVMSLIKDAYYGGACADSAPERTSPEYTVMHRLPAQHPPPSPITGRSSLLHLWFLEAPERWFAPETSKTPWLSLPR